MSQIKASILFHIPHASRLIPDEWRSLFVLDDLDLQRELITMTDSFTDELFDIGDSVDYVRFPVSRLLVDPERFPRDEDEPMSSRGMGAIYTRTHDGRPMKPNERSTDLMNAYYHPHHAALTDWTQKRLLTDGRCLIIDCHSYPSEPIACDMNQEPNRPDICFGTCDPHTPPDLVQAATEAFESVGFTTAVDWPYAGTIVPLEYVGNEARVSSLMIEVNRKLYMDEATGSKSELFDQTRIRLQKSITSIVSKWTACVGDLGGQASSKEG
jgi:N-formylglutamate amidohydrolase